METKTINCPVCHSSNFYSDNDEMIRCRACGNNIRIEKQDNQNAGTPPEPIIRVPEDAPSISGRPNPILANTGERLGTYLVDQFITAMVFILMLAASGSNGNVPDLNLYIAALTIPAYYTLLEGSNGKTIGKLLVGTRVLNEDGSPIGYTTALARTLCRMIPFEVFSIFFHNGRCWHDLITRTYVIKDR